MTAPHVPVEEDMYGLTDRESADVLLFLYGYLDPATPEASDEVKMAFSRAWERAVIGRSAADLAGHPPLPH